MKNPAGLWIAMVLALVAAQPGRTDDRFVRPGQEFPGELLNIRAPNSEGWQLMQSSPEGWIFAKEGATSNSSYVASILTFEISTDASADDFVNEVKRLLGDVPDRFNVLESAFEPTTERGYPCVKYSTVTEDKKAKVSMFRREVQFLQLHALYCRHPQRPTFGFGAIYSHRGKELDGNVPLRAEEFIGGIVVPPTPGEPAAAP